MVPSEPNSLAIAHQSCPPMPTATRFATSPLPHESAGNRVVRVPELVSTILSHLNQAELARISSLNSIVRSESDRLLYRSPVIVDWGETNVRLARLLSSLEGRAGQVHSLKLSSERTKFPAGFVIEALVNQLSVFSSLSLSGE